MQCNLSIFPKLVFCFYYSIDLDAMTTQIGCKNHITFRIGVAKLGHLVDLQIVASIVVLVRFKLFNYI